MKKSLVLMYMFFCSSLVFGQIKISEWAPIGANWIYTYPTFNGEWEFVNISHSKDTFLSSHLYKKFDVRNGVIREGNTSTSIWDTFLYSYFVGIYKDTVFQYFDNKEIYFVDRDSIGEKVFPYRQCDPNDSAWYKLDTFFYTKYSNSLIKNRVYSSNIGFGRTGSILKDTLKDFLQDKLGLAYDYDTKDAHSYLLYSGSKKCIFNNRVDPIYSNPNRIGCYYDNKLGDIDFGYGICYARTFSKVNNSNNKLINIYPNPSSTDLFVDANTLTSEYYIYSLDGKYMCSGKIGLSKKINIEHIPIGDFFISIQNKSEVFFVKKITKK